jgi:hypothetical protein
MMMEANPITKQVLDLQKGAFSSWYGAMSSLQEQAALTVDTMLNQATWIPDEGRQAILSWVSAWKNEGDRFKTYVEESYSGFEKRLVQEIRTAPAKPKQTVAEAKKATPAKPKQAVVEAKKAAPAKPKQAVVEAKKAAPAKHQKPVAEEKKATSAQEIK